MKKLTETDIKKLISESKARELYYARTIVEMFPQSNGIHVRYKIEHTDFAGHIERSNEYDLLPKDRLCIQVPCPNRDCTQGYFSLTSEADKCLRYGKEVSGKMRCHGKEDFKYYDHNGFTCDTTIDYIITPL